MLRFVLDTNVVLDLFHWANTDAVPIMAALEAGRIECFADERTLDELQRVLTYPQLKMTPEMIVERYARYSGLITMVEPGEAPKLPRCKDRDDIQLTAGKECLYRLQTHSASPTPHGHMQ